jgi:hypothetical protein
MPGPSASVTRGVIAGRYSSTFETIRSCYEYEETLQGLVSYSGLRHHRDRIKQPLNRLSEVGRIIHKSFDGFLLRKRRRSRLGLLAIDTAVRVYLTRSLCVPDVPVLQ